ncbi:MAG: hypothetical protein ACFCUM_19785 [Bacteroidales bacterium]
MEYHIGTPAWDEKVENSKFDTGYFGKYIEGVTGLQDHIDDVRFRIIKIRAY